jgi:sugar phosphate isomerase/epimerase
MKLGRREFIAAAAALGSAQAQPGPAAQPPKPRTRPSVCIHSQVLLRLHYSELGGVIKAMGFDGCDLTVRPGGHVQPERAPADMVRAIEGIRDEGVDVPMISTAFYSAAEPWARNVMAIAGGMGVPFFTAGPWVYGNSMDVPAKVAEVRREVAGLMLLGRTYNISMALPNRVGDNVGGAVWDGHAMISDLDAKWVGHHFDVGAATVEGGLNGWHVALRLALPRLKTVAVNDFYWSKEGGKWTVKTCPLGEGMVDWARFFALLAQAKFAGPISLRVDYDPAGNPAAIVRDLEWVRKQVGAAFGNVT